MAYGIGAGVADTEPVPYGNTETVITKWSQTVNITSDATHILVDLLITEKIQLVFQYSFSITKCCVFICYKYKSYFGAVSIKVANQLNRAKLF